MVFRLLRAIMVLLAVAVPARAQAVLDAILARGVVRVGLTGDYRPFSIKDEAGRFEGLDVDMAESLAKGIKRHQEPSRWRR